MTISNLLASDLIPVGASIEQMPDTDFVCAVRNDRGTPYLLVAQSDRATELREALQDHPVISAGVLLGNDGDAVAVMRKSFRTGDIDAIPSVDGARPAQEGFRFTILGHPTTKSLMPLTSKLENVLFEVHSALRDIDGLHAPDALDEICKLIYVKIFDEEETPDGARHRFQRGVYNSVEECAASIRSLYLEAVRDDEAVFANRIPSYARSRGVFRDPIKISSVALARAVALLEAFDLSSSPVDIKGRAFQSVLAPATRAGMGQYFTPKSVISLCIDLLAPTARDVIIDPFCGSGHFLTSALEYVRADAALPIKQLHEFAFGRLHGIEKSDRMVRVAMTDMRLHGDGHSNIRCTDALLPFSNYPDLLPESFDIVATNPPFGIDLPKEALAELGPFEIIRERKGSSGSVSLEIVAIDRCLALLRPGGRMAIVIPDGILSNRGLRYVRETIQHSADLKAIVSLPVETFSPFGANIKTSILIMRKHYPGEKSSEEQDIFLADIKSVGHDASGRIIPCDDFKSLAQQFAQFIDREGW